MKSNPIGTMRNLRDVASESWFLFASARGKHLAMAVTGNPQAPGTVVGYLELIRYSPEPSLVARLGSMERDRAPDVLELAGVELDVPPDVAHIYPDAMRPDANELWKAGALIITPDECAVVFVDKEEDMGMINLADGTLNWTPREKSIALVSRWRLIQRLGNEVREICSIQV